MRMRPEAGRTKPATARSAVVLPEPEGPIMARISPAATAMRQRLQHDSAAIGDADLVEGRRPSPAAAFAAAADSAEVKAAERVNVSSR